MSQSLALRLYLLGDFRLERDRQPVHLSTRKVESLLAYLVLHRDVPQSRQYLAFQFWPDSSEGQARTNLRQLLHGLRQTLPESDQFVQADAQTLQWRGDAPFRLDVSEFEEALAQANAAEKHGNPHALRVALEQASAIYQGDLLPSRYDDWILPERERLRQVFMETLERLMLLLESQGEPRAAIVHAQRLLRHDPLREETYRGLMRLYAACGDRAGALRIYHTCATVLERELAVEPSAATREAYAQLLKVDMQARPVMPPQPSNTNLPVPLTSFVGREAEMTEVRHLLQTTRLLTLTGPGGCGKTRLALEAATNLLDEYSDGVWWIELAALSDTALVPQAVATALGVREQSGRPLLETLTDFLRAKQLLLLLDNCEHLVDACAQLAEQLLSACPHLHILATSREALSIGGETTWLVPSLSLPEAQPPSTLEQLSRYESIRLFVERAVSALPTFRLTATNAPLVGQICRRLDGIPLAIELVAARVKVLHVEQIAARLDDVFQLLTAGSRTMLRHQTLRAAMDWSYDLLSDQERMLFRRLSVFAGGFTLEAAEVICAGEGLAEDEVLDWLSHLVDKSLVAVTQNGETRYRLLETIRQHAHDKLIASEGEQKLRARHLDYFLKLATEAEPELRGSEQMVWLNRLEMEHDNLSAAGAWSLQKGEAESGLRLAGALWRFWDVRGYLKEGREWLEKWLVLPGLVVDKRTQAKALFSAGALAWSDNDYAAAHRCLEPCVTLWRELGDQAGLGYASVYLGLVALRQGDFDSAGALFEQSKTYLETAADKWGLALTLGHLGNLTRNKGDYATARIRFEQALVISRQAGDRKLTASLLNNLGEVARCEGNYEQAFALYNESLSLIEELGDNRELAKLHHNLAYVARYLGDYRQATRLFEKSLDVYRESDDKRGMVLCLAGLACVAEAEGQSDRAVRLFATVERWLQSVGMVMSRADQVEVDRSMRAVCDVLGEETFAAVQVEGRAMSLEQAIAYALRTDG